MKTYQLLTKEHVTSIREVQKNPSQALRGVTRVMRGAKTLGFFFSHNDFDELLEDLEAASSSDLRRRVRAARAGLKKDQVVGLKEVAAKYAR